MKVLQMPNSITPTRQWLNVVLLWLPSIPNCCIMDGHHSSGRTEMSPRFRSFHSTSPKSHRWSWAQGLVDMAPSIHKACFRASPLHMRVARPGRVYASCTKLWEWSSRPDVEYHQLPGMPTLRSIQMWVRHWSRYCRSSRRSPQCRYS
jgi:hypothetical protein